MVQKRSNKILGSDVRSNNKTVEWKEYRAPHGETRTINEKSIPKYAQSRIQLNMPSSFDGNKMRGSKPKTVRRGRELQ